MSEYAKYASEEKVGYRIVKSYLAGDARANRCYATLSPDEQQRLLTGARHVQGDADAARYVWEYLNERSE